MFREAVEEYGSISEAARKVGMSRTTFRRRLAKEERGRGIKQQGLTEEELLLKVSPEHQILHAAQSIPPGRFIPEREFVRGLHLAGGYKHIVEKEKFAPYRGRAAGNEYYWACEESMKKMKDEAILT